MNSTKFTYQQYKYVIFNSYAPIFWAGGHNHRFVIWLKKTMPRPEAQLEAESAASNCPLVKFCCFSLLLLR